jgi:hypothetical protein
MAGLYKKEVLIRPVSTITVQGAKDFAKNWLKDTFQDVDSNKDADGNYIDFFFADIFDARNGNIYRVYSEACDEKYSMGGALEFEILNNVQINQSIDAVNSAVEETNENLTAIENVVYSPEAIVI